MTDNDPIFDDLTDFGGLAHDKAGSGKPSVVLIWAIILIICGVVLAVINHARSKPASPQELVVTAFNQVMKPQEWQPGMGPQPFIYHPAGFGTQPMAAAAGFGTGATAAWQPLYLCPQHGSDASPVFDKNGVAHCSICNQFMVMNR